MAQPTTAQLNVLRATQALFQAAPGKANLADWSAAYPTVDSFVKTAVTTPLWNDVFGYGGLDTAATYTKFIDNLLGNNVNATTKAALVQEAVSYTGTGKTFATSADGIVFLIDKLANLSETDPDFGNAAKAFNNKVEVNTYYSIDKGQGSASSSLGELQAVSADVTSNDATVTTVISRMDIPWSATQNLSVNQDNLTGSTLADTFKAVIVNNSNTLQSGDKIDGKGGIDSLSADIGNSQSFAITAETSNVENVSIRAQATNAASGDSNLAGKGVQIDAERMTGVNHWTDSQSRTDLVIEDVSIQDNQITKDITIEMNGTDPGHVDFGFYFDPHSLRNVSSSTSVLNLQVMDTRDASRNGAGFDQTQALLETPYNRLSIQVNGQEYLLTVDTQVAPTGVATFNPYDTLLVRIQAALKNASTATGQVVDLTTMGVTASKGSAFTVVDPAYNAVGPLTGYNITLTGENVVLANGNGWTVAGAPPSSTGFHTLVVAGAPSTSVELVTSKVILDDVGRSNIGGDLVIGSMSTGIDGINPGAGGVGRFEIEVRDNSQLQTINSTNNALKEVTIESGATDRVGDAYYPASEQGKGDLSVNGSIFAGVAGTNVALPGSTAQHNAFGFSDVRLIDASTFNGDLSFTAEITPSSLPKYLNLVDTQVGPAVDNVHFVYNGGNGNDAMNVQIDGGVLASRSTLMVGREDFDLKLDGGAGNDRITLHVVDSALTGIGQNWYNNQDINNNVTINGGAGDDVIRTPGAGDLRLNGDAGNDVFYTDNSGVQAAVWVTNAVDGNGAVAGNQYDVYDLRSNVPASVSAVNAQLTVNYRGLAKTVDIANSVGSLTNVTITDLDVNQAIKNAINNDATLKNLLSAEDGPGRTLVIKSLIDGAQVLGNLDISFTSTALTAAQAGLNLFDNAAGSAEFTTLASAVNEQFGQEQFAGVYTDIVGANSISTSDNIITPGADNDMIVLGTTVGADIATSSNETVIFGENFGNDVIVNFAPAGNGVDSLDFTAILGGAPGPLGAAVSNTNRSITVVAETAANDNAAEIAALYGTAANASATTHLYVAYNAHNVGDVYKVVDAAGAGGVTATLQGSIDLADAGWGTLVAANFVYAGAAGYYLDNGPTTGAGTGGVVPPVLPPTYTLAATPTTVDEGSNVTLTLTTANVADGTVVPYTLTGVQATDITGGAVAGSFTINNNVGAATVAIAADLTTEGTETMVITAASQTASVVINDTSVASGSFTNVNADVGSAATQTTLDASTGSYNYTDSATAENNVRITGFGTNDQITVTGATAAQYGTAISTNGVGDVTFAYNNNGTLNQIELAGVAGTALVYDVASFNALPVGDILFV